MKRRYQKTRKTTLIVTVASLALALMTAPPISARTITDKDVESAINTEIASDSAISANNIDVSVKEWIVTLTGNVDSILAKERAQALAEATVGVRAIVNRIEVRPITTRDDTELETAIEEAWMHDPVADSYELQASAKDGVVTLTGTVNSFAEKDISETVAKGVKGVRSIKNNIKIDYTTDRIDYEIVSEIKERLNNDVRVDGYLIDVEVKDGNVTLSGTVGSLQEKNQAVNDAWVAGVKSVDKEGLTIQWWAVDEMKRVSTHVSRTDKQIKKAVEDAFLYDPRVFSFEPDVTVENGTVTLNGIVDNLQAKKAAEQDAKNTLGVWRVKNHLKVRADIPENPVLEQRVATALLADPHVERYEIDVEAHSGWVYLSGDVKTSFEKNQAERVTEGVKGVVGVVNNLTSDYVWTWKPDWEIRHDVRDQLRWSPFVDDNNIAVLVADGVVTLRGTVSSWSERDEAEKNAYQGGAKDVENDLAADYGYYGPYGPGYYGSPYYHGPDYYGPDYEPYD